jgi:hypothetical protein
MTKTKVRKIELKQKANQTKEQTLSEFRAKPEYTSASIMEAFNEEVEGNDFYFQSAMEVIEKTNHQIKSGDLSKIEEMYLSQAVSLEAIFATLARRATNAQYREQFQTYMQLALKAQNQSRATLQALVQLKQPSQTTFVKQANIAQGHQQVNNLPEKNITPQNELLRGDYAKLDSRATPKAKRANSKVEALDKINRG